MKASAFYFLLKLTVAVGITIGSLILAQPGSSNIPVDGDISNIVTDEQTDSTLENPDNGCSEDPNVACDVLPGDEGALAAYPGRGFNHISGEILGQCVVLGEFKNTSGNKVPGMKTAFRLLEITSESQLRNELGVSASASFSAGFGEVSGRASFVKDVNKHTQSRYLMVHTVTANELELASDYTFDKEVQGLVENSTNDPFAFADACGTEFIYGRRTGGEFFAVVEFEIASEGQNQAFNAAIRGAGGGWSGGADVSEKLSQFNQAGRTQVRLYMVGGKENVPQIKDIQDFARKFPSLVSTSEGSPVTIELISKNYKGVKPFDLKPKLLVLEEQEDVLEELASYRDKASELLNSVVYIKNNRSAYNIDPSVHTLDKWKQSLEASIKQINDTAKSCKRNPLENCERLKDPSLIGINLPERKQQELALAGTLTGKITIDGTDDEYWPFKPEKVHREYNNIKMTLREGEPPSVIDTPAVPWGGECRVELRLKARMTANHAVQIEGDAKLFEGTSENSNELAAQKAVSFSVPKDGKTVKHEIRLVNNEPGGGDHAEIILNFTNSVIE